MKRILALILVFTLCGCDTGIRQMGLTEMGVKFRKLPPALGGGVSSEVIPPGKMAIIFPWESIYRFDTRVRDVSWGTSKGDESTVDYVHTRALDGNEVALAVTVRYQIGKEPGKLVRLVQEVATDDHEVSELVKAVGRADIRTYMNELRTSEFMDESHRYQAVDKVRNFMAERLSQYGIEILRVTLDDFRFERLLKDGTIDTSYQDKLTEVSKLIEDTKRERSRIDTIKAKKEQEFNTAQAEVNRLVAEADGYKKQAKLKGDAYFEARTNEAKAILAQGKAEVEGIVEQINALSGPGGQAILKLELARQLLKQDPRFVLVNPGDNKSLDVTRTDTNELLNQIGILEAWKKESAPAINEVKP